MYLWFSPDPTLTVENVASVMEKVAVDKRRQLWERVLRMLKIVDEIYSSHSSEKEKTHACSDVYVNCHPESSWEHLTSLLYEEDEMAAVDQARPFLPPRGKLYTLIIIVVTPQCLRGINNPQRMCCRVTVLVLSVSI